VTTKRSLNQSAILTIIVTSLILISSSGLINFNISNVNADIQTLIVPDKYATINAAIGAATQGDTILVRKGIYYENPIIEKKLTLIAEETGNTLIIGAGGVERGAKPVFTLAANNITLKGFTIKSQNYNQTNYAAGINLAGDNCIITENIIEGTYYGIFSSVQSSNLISNNTIRNTLKDGIRICGGSTNTIKDNTIIGNAQSGIAIGGYLYTVKGNLLQNNYRGIGLGASYSLIFNNTLKENSESGLYIATSNSLIVSNNIAQSKWGVYFTSYFAAPNNNTFYKNNIANNTQQAGISSVYNSQIWDNGAQGNYWGNYKDTDSNNDGIGDLSFMVYDANEDRYPLMSPYALPKNAIQPELPIPSNTVKGIISLWHFDNIEPNGVTPDSLSNNPVVLEVSGNNFYTPILVDGKTGNALRFNGTDYAYLTSSPTLEIQREFTIDAWVKVQEFKNIPYNNILVECMRTPDKFPTRIFGFAINGESPLNISSPRLGALRGFLLDEKGVFNEIVTTDSVVQMNQWVHVVFTRSLSTGMHIYVNDSEENVEVTSGSQNPQDLIAKGTEFYIGHDSLSTIDEMSINSSAIQPTASQTSLWAEWWFWATIMAGTVFTAGIALFLKQSRKP
jgi:parallel beta-helix repeat protein